MTLELEDVLLAEFGEDMEIAVPYVVGRGSGFVGVGYFQRSKFIQGSIVRLSTIMVPAVMVRVPWTIVVQVEFRWNSFSQPADK